MSWPEEDSAHLMQRLKEGDDRAFKKIFDKYYVPLRSYAFRYVGDDSRTDNFVQDAFLIVWERKEDFQVLFALKRFLYVSVKSVLELFETSSRRETKSFGTDKAFGKRTGRRGHFRRRDTCRTIPGYRRIVRTGKKSNKSVDGRIVESGNRPKLKYFYSFCQNLLSSGLTKHYERNCQN